VLRLRRTAYGGVQLGRLKPGESRDLSAVEAARLRRAVGR
jgi:16S rRNA U516 pseudouridylate synthase RsuA-like enzyme